MFGGLVIHGDKIGRQFGYPTANLDVSADKVNLKGGVYAVDVLLNKKKYQGALALQENPWKVEVYIFDYKGKEFYGSHLEIDPIQKVSEMGGFSTKDELKEKIERDIEMVRRVFKSRK
jgi:riboflavin kinase / FMN adenylyltransferase